MTEPRKTLGMSLVVPLVAAASVLLAFALWGQARGVGALAGAAVSVLNWVALRWFMGRLAKSSQAGGGSSQGALSLLLVAKMGLLMAAVYVLISKLGLDPLGVLVGLSTLFFAPVLGGLLRSPVHGPTAAQPAREER